MFCGSVQRELFAQSERTQGPTNNVVSCPGRQLAAVAWGQRGFATDAFCVLKCRHSIIKPQPCPSRVPDPVYMRSQALAAMQGEHAALGAALDEIKKRKDAAKKAIVALTNEQRKARTRCAPWTCRV